MKKALFFDLDGTLWDAIIPLTESWNKAMESVNEPFRFNFESMKSFMGLTPEETVPLAFKGKNLQEGMKLFNICLHDEIEYLSHNPGKMYPYEEEVLDLLSKKYPLYIISNCGKGYIENYLNALHMKKYFVDKTCIGDTGLEKWQNILYLKERDKIDEIIYIGDTNKDKIESLKANVRFIHARYGFGKIKDETNYIDDLKELDDVVTKIFKE